MTDLTGISSGIQGIYTNAGNLQKAKLSDVDKTIDDSLKNITLKSADKNKDGVTTEQEFYDKLGSGVSDKQKQQMWNAVAMFAGASSKTLADGSSEVTQIIDGRAHVTHFNADNSVGGTADDTYRMHKGENLLSQSYASDKTVVTHNPDTGIVTTETLDANGLKVKFEEDGKGTIIQTNYDANGKVTGTIKRSVKANGNEFIKEFDAKGHMLKSTLNKSDGSSVIDKYEFTAGGSYVAERIETKANGTSTKLNISWNKDGSHTEVTESYNAKGKLTGTVTNEYNAKQQITSKEVKNSKGQVTSTTINEYQSDGVTPKKTSVTSGGKTTDTNFNENGKLTEKSVTQNGKTTIIEKRYYLEDGSISSKHTYNSDGSLKSSYSYNQNGTIDSYVLKNKDGSEKFTQYTGGYKIIVTTDSNGHNTIQFQTTAGKNADISKVTNQDVLNMYENILSQYGDA